MENAENNLEKNMVEEKEAVNSEMVVAEENPEETQDIVSSEEQGVSISKDGQIQEKKIEVKTRKKILQGKVVSNKPNKTIVVLIERQVAHPIYKKYYKRSKKVMAHDENNECGIGDVVRVIESRPLSARKRWRLIEIVEKAK